MTFSNITMNKWLSLLNGLACVITIEKPCFHILVSYNKNKKFNDSTFNNNLKGLKINSLYTHKKTQTFSFSQN